MPHGWCMARVSRVGPDGIAGPSRNAVVFCADFFLLSCFNTMRNSDLCDRSMHIMFISEILTASKVSITPNISSWLFYWSVSSKLEIKCSSLFLPFILSIFFTKTPPGGQTLLVPELPLNTAHPCGYTSTAVSQMPPINILLVQFLTVERTMLKLEEQILLLVMPLYLQLENNQCLLWFTISFLAVYAYCMVMKCFVVEFVLQVLHGVLTAQGGRAAGWFFVTSRLRWMELHAVRCAKQLAVCRRQ